MQDQHNLQTLRRTMRGIVEDVLREGGVLTTDEIYRGVKAKHALLRQLLPPRWQEKVSQILEVHCISHEGNSWFLENIEQLEERPECEASLFDPHGASERIINDSTGTDWANTESYRYLDLAPHVAGDMARNVALGTFLSGLHQLRRLANLVYLRGHDPIWRLWRLRQAGRDEAGRQGHSPERAKMPLPSPSSITRPSSKMPGTFESALRFNEGVMRAPSTEASRPAAGAITNRPLGLTGHFDRLSEQELRDRIKQKLEKLGLLLSDRRTAR